MSILRHLWFFIIFAVSSLGLCAHMSFGQGMGFPGAQFNPAFPFQRNFFSSSKLTTPGVSYDCNYSQDRQDLLSNIKKLEDKNEDLLKALRISECEKIKNKKVVYTDADIDSFMDCIVSLKLSDQESLDFQAGAYEYSQNLKALDTLEKSKQEFENNCSSS